MKKKILIVLLLCFSFVFLLIPSKNAAAAETKEVDGQYTIKYEDISYYMVFNRHYFNIQITNQKMLLGTLNNIDYYLLCVSFDLFIAGPISYSYHVIYDNLQYNLGEIMAGENGYYMGNLDHSFFIENGQLSICTTLQQTQYILDDYDSMFCDYHYIQLDNSDFDGFNLDFSTCRYNLRFANTLDSYHQGFEDGLDAGYEQGSEDGRDVGFEEGFDAGNKKGYRDGYTEGYDVGYEDGAYEVGGDQYNKGYESGYKDGEQVGNDKGYKTGFEKGKDAGYTLGYNDGFNYDDYDFTNLLWTIAGLPFVSFQTIFDVEFLGLNLAEFITGLLMFGVILFIIKKVFL